MARSVLFAVALPLLLVLAGCAGSSGLEDDVAPPPRCPRSDCPDEAVLEGNVLDDQQFPIAGATVALREADLETVTNDAGAFRFEGLAPGPYTVLALRLGFDSTATRVQVGPGLTTVTIELRQIVIQVPFHEVLGPMDGFFSCGVGTPSVIRMCHSTAPALFGSDTPRLEFEMTADHWQTFVGEMRWQQGTFATSSHLANYMSYVGRSGSHWWCAADGNSPIVFRYEQDLESDCSDRGSQDPQPSTELRLFVAADTGFGGLSAENPPVRVTVQQRFQLMMSIFYGDPAPAEFTAFPDA